ncbi:MAG: type II toxin-antitoxin system RelE/ParE family toxin [Selenomonadaceae bacterium]|nr:type II toxin-antitoxin system RelE/ParE family toxin [Selenomonadaceae bacterium]
MKVYTIEYTENAKKAIDKLDLPIRNRIKEWINKNLEGCENPRFSGKALKGNLNDKWRYRVGGYRIIVEIQDNKLIILVVNVSKRNDTYKKKNKK